MELPSAKKAGIASYRSASVETTNKPVSKDLQSKGVRALPKWLLWAVVLAVVVGAWYAFQGTKSAPTVSVEAVRQAQLKTSFTAEAYVRGKEYQLSPQAAGRIKSLLVREGDSVRRGQLLLRLDDSEALAMVDQAKAAHEAALSAQNQASSELAAARLTASARIQTAKAALRSAEASRNVVKAGARPQEIAQAQARVEQADAARVEAQRSNERAQMLYKQGAVARANADAAEARFLSARAELSQAKQALALLKAGARRDEMRAAEARVDAARSDVDLARASAREIDARVAAVSTARAKVSEAASAVRRAQATLAMLDVVAPDDGVVSKLIGESGTQAMPGVPVLTLSSRRDLRIDAEISTEDAAKAKPGMLVRVTSPAYPGRSFAAKVTSLSPVGELKPDAAIRTRIVRARVELEGDWNLFRPGMEVDVEGESVMKQALVVPADALTFSGARTAVWVVDAAGKVHRRDVEPGFSNATETEILKGLKEGETVVLDGKDALKEGQEVKAKK